MKIFKSILFIFGLGLLVFLIHQVGLETIFRQVDAMGWKFLIIPLFMLPKNVAHVIGWLRMAKARGQHVSFLELYRFKLMEPAVNTMSMMHVIGGDIIRAILMKEHLPWREASLLILLDRISLSISGLALIFIGFVASFQFFTFPATAMVQLGFIVLLIIALAIVVFLMRHRLYHLLKRRWRDKVVRADGAILNALRHNKRIFSEACLWNFLGRLFSPLEIWVILVFLGFDGPALFAVVASSVSNLVTLIFSYVPAEIGVMEVGMALMFKMAGYGTALGLSFQFIRRLNSLVWLGIGSTLLLLGKKKELPAVTSAQT